MASSGTGLAAEDRFDDGQPLSAEELQALEDVEQKHNMSLDPLPANQPLSQPQTTPSKRRRSASPHETPTRLRSTVKPTTRFLDAGFKPNNSHSFRRAPLADDQSPDPPPPPPPPSIEHSASVSDNSRRSASADVGHAFPRGSPQPPVPYPYPQYGQPPNPQARPPQLPAIPPPAGPPHPQAVSRHPPALPYPQAIPPHAGPLHPQAVSPHLPPMPHHPQAMPPHPQMMPHHPSYPPYLQPPGYAHAHSNYPPYGSQYFAPIGPDASHDVSSYYVRQDLERSSQVSQSPHPQGGLACTPSSEKPTPPPVDNNKATNIPSNIEKASDRPGSPLVDHLQPDVTSRRSDTSDTVRSTSGSLQELVNRPVDTLGPIDNLGPVVTPASLPSISVQPATPTAGPNRHSLPSRRSNEGSNEEDPGFDLFMDSPTIGRISNASRDALRNGFKELDACIKRISEDSGISPVQIVERWDVARTRTVSSWNIYQAYFEERQDEEIARLPPDERPTPGTIHKKSTVKAAYDAFKAEKGDRFDQILKSWYRLRQMSDSGDMSHSKRSREFQKHVKNIENTIRHASTLFGFETIFITLGGVVNQDQNLAHLGGSDGTIDFFLERYHSPDTQVLGHAKAHVYDRLSKRMSKEDEATQARASGTPSAIHARDSPTSSPTRASSAVRPSVKVEPSTAVVGDVTATELRDKFKEWTGKEGIDLVKGMWKKLPQSIAGLGYVILNWPEDVPFPCDDTAGKGVSGLKRKERIALFSAFNHPTHPLTLDKRHTSGVPTNEPVIFGVPPDPNSPHTHGRRKFLNAKLNEDRHGPARLKLSTSSLAPKTIEKPRAPSVSNKKRSSSKRVADDEPAVASGSDDDFDDYDNNFEKSLPKGKTTNTTTRKKARCAQPEFIEPDDTDDPNILSDAETYLPSGTENGTENDVTIVRSPPHLRSKPHAKQRRNAKKPKALRKSVTTPAEESDRESVSKEDAADMVSKSSEPGKKSSHPNPRSSPQALSAKRVHPDDESSLADKVAGNLFGESEESPRGPKRPRHESPDTVATQTGDPATRRSVDSTTHQTGDSMRKVPDMQPLPSYPSLAHQLPLQYASDHGGPSRPPAISGPPATSNLPPQNLPPQNLPPQAWYQAPPPWYPPPDQGHPAHPWYAPPDHNKSARPPSTSNPPIGGDQGHPGHSWYAAPDHNKHAVPSSTSNPPIGGPPYPDRYWAPHNAPYYTNPYAQYQPSHVQPPQWDRDRDAQPQNGENEK